MFEEKTTTENPTEPEDILAEVDVPTEPLVVGPQGPITMPIKSSGAGNERKKFFTLIIGVLVVVLIGFSAWLTYAKLIRVNQEKTSPITPTPTETAPAAIPSPKSETPVQTPSNLDSDNDGLTDAEEGQLGTDPFKADTDGDGLNDHQEAKVYLTNPLNPDTDGDGYLDGEEVSHGYDPKDPTYGAKLEK